VRRWLLICLVLFFISNCSYGQSQEFSYPDTLFKYHQWRLEYVHDHPLQTPFVVVGTALSVGSLLGISDDASLTKGMAIAGAIINLIGLVYNEKRIVLVIDRNSAMYDLDSDLLNAPIDTINTILSQEQKETPIGINILKVVLLGAAVLLFAISVK